MPFVRMTDTFMSGWGPAKGMTNVYVVECDNEQQAEQIETAAHRRNEMKHIQIVDNIPRDRPGILITHKHYSELGAVWKA